MVILNFSESLAKSLVMAKLNMAYLSSLKKPSKTAVFFLGYSVPPALHCTIWCRSTFGPRGSGLSNPTYLLPEACSRSQGTDHRYRSRKSRSRSPNIYLWHRQQTTTPETDYPVSNAVTVLHLQSTIFVLIVYIVSLVCFGKRKRKILKIRLWKRNE